MHDCETPYFSAALFWENPIFFDCSIISAFDFKVRLFLGLWGMGKFATIFVRFLGGWKVQGFSGRHFDSKSYTLIRVVVGTLISVVVGTIGKLFTLFLGVPT